MEWWVFRAIPSNAWGPLLPRLKHGTQCMRSMYSWLLNYLSSLTFGILRESSSSRHDRLLCFILLGGTHLRVLRIFFGSVCRDYSWQCSKNQMQGSTRVGCIRGKPLNLCTWNLSCSRLLILFLSLFHLLRSIVEDKRLVTNWVFG